MSVLARSALAAIMLLGVWEMPAIPAAAQATGTVRGIVTDATTQRPLPGAAVSVAGTNRRVVTGSSGEYTLPGVPAGQTRVRVELVGYSVGERVVAVSAGQTETANFALDPSAVALDALVVTALGIEREQRSLTTSTETVAGAELAEARETNLVTALTGKVAGVQITNANTPGGSARIVIRGANSITGNNQPLFVVDGIPVSNEAVRAGTRGYNAIDYGNAIQDINPNDIASITVLKGPNAAALYGSRAANGAILITTKSGRRVGEPQITASTNVTFETPLRLPEYQNLYGQGWNGQFAYVDGRGGGLRDDEDQSWGPRLDGQLIPQFNSPVVNGVRQATPWVPNPNNVRDFFETGRTANTSVSFATSSENANVRLSLSRLDQEGMYPGFEMERTNVALHGGSHLTSKLRTDASVQYINHEADNRPAQGYGGANAMWQFLWFGRQVDVNALRERTRNPDGTQFNWNNIWNNNPYFTAFENTNYDSRNRVIGNASATYDFTAWLNGTVRAGTDWYEENRRLQYAAGNYSVSSVDANGALGEDNVFRQETNADFLLNATVPRTGEFDVNVDFGGSVRENRYRSNAIYIRNLAVPGNFSYLNYADPPATNDYRSRQQVNSLYGQARLAFRDLWFLDVSGRNDWSSTLPDANNSYFYPAVSTSVVFSELVPVPALSFGRLRAGWTQVGNDAGPYQLVNIYPFDLPFAGATRLTASNSLRNPDLRPEQTEAWEVGTDMRFLNDRLGVEATYYRKATTDQILDLDISAMTGFTSRIVNAGKISTRGVELLVDATPVRFTNGLEWNVTATYSRDRTYVDELYGDLGNIILGDYYGVQVRAQKGERYGAMYGRKYVRDSQGNIVVGSNGLPLSNAANPFGYLGNYHPDWIGSLSNRFAFRGLDLSVLFDTRQGGSIYSLTSVFGRRSGVLAETLEGREVANNIADGGGLIVKGVKVVNGDTVPNDIKVTAQSYHRAITTASSVITEQFTYDASFIKLREVRLGYSVPSSYTRRWGVDGLRVALVGRNLWLNTDVPHIDPETAFDATNVQGFEHGQMPSARSIGFNITVTP